MHHIPGSLGVDESKLVLLRLDRRRILDGHCRCTDSVPPLTTPRCCGCSLWWDACAGAEQAVVKPPDMYEMLLVPLALRAPRLLSWADRGSLADVCRLGMTRRVNLFDCPMAYAARVVGGDGTAWSKLLIVKLAEPVEPTASSSATGLPSASRKISRAFSIRKVNSGWRAAMDLKSIHGMSSFSAFRPMDDVDLVCLHLPRPIAPIMLL